MRGCSRLRCWKRSADVKKPWSWSTEVSYGFEYALFCIAYFIPMLTVLEKRRQGRQAKKAAKKAAAAAANGEDQPMDQVDQAEDAAATPDEDETPVEKKYRKRIQRNPKPSKFKLSIEERLENERLREQEYEATMRKLEAIEPDMEAGDVNATSEWLDLAGTLLDGFRETKALFPTDGVRLHVFLIAGC